MKKYSYLNGARRAAEWAIHNGSSLVGLDWNFERIFEVLPPTVCSSVKAITKHTPLSLNNPKALNRLYRDQSELCKNDIPYRDIFAVQIGNLKAIDGDLTISNKTKVGKKMRNSECLSFGKSSSTLYCNSLTT